MIKRITKSTLRKLGFEVHRLTPSETVTGRLTGIELFFQTWKMYGHMPSFIIDVGANHGSWTRGALKHFPNANFLLIEPQQRLKQYSEDLLALENVRWRTAGIGDHTGELLLSLPPRDDSATFRLTTQEAQQQGHPQEMVKVTTLDDIVDEENQIPDIVKIDAEGFDLRALHGASNLFDSTEVFLVECGVCCPGLENSVSAVCAFMDQKGYQVFDITDLNRSPKQNVLWLTELVFVSKTSSIWKSLTNYD